MNESDFLGIRYFMGDRTLTGKGRYFFGVVRDRMILGDVEVTTLRVGEPTLFLLEGGT